MLLTPAGVFTVGLTGAAQVADLVLVAHSIHSVVGQLAALDRALGEQLLDADGLAIEGLSRLGELAEMNSTALDGVANEVIFQLAMSVGGKWVLTRDLVAAQSFVSDVEALLAATPEKE